MNYTISDFYSTYKESLKLLSGKGGFSRRVTSVGILDYEFLPEVSGKYRHYNFDEGQLVVSTLMYARDNPNLVTDAIKDLINAGTSGLVIKNIFKISIPETILRYAEAKNYPVFILDTENIYVEDIIFDVKTAIIRQSSAGNVERLLDAIASSISNEQEVFSHAKLINPSFETQHKVYYIFLGDHMTRDSFAERLRRYIGSPLDIPEATLAPFGRGILYITTWEHRAFLKDDAIVEAIREELDLPYSSVGISSIRYYLGELGYSIREATYAALISQEWGDAFVKFEDLGLLRLIFPLADDKAMQDFSQKILAPIRDFDIENNGKLMETLAAWSGYGMSFPEAAKDLHQHENTLRYRMDKIAGITGLDFKKAPDAQQLNMAYLIDYCRELKEKL